MHNQVTQTLKEIMIMLQVQNTIENSVVINLVAGSVLKKRRALLGISEKTLGQIVGASKQDIIKYENNELDMKRNNRIFTLHSVISLFAM